MAQPAGLYDTYDLTSIRGGGLRQSLSDMIYNVSPTDTPFLTMMSKVSAGSTIIEWQIDSLAAATTANTQADGDDAVLTEPAPTSQINNRTQIMTKNFGVSGTAQAIDKAGRANELGYQLSKRSAEIKRDLESTLLNNQASSVGTTVSGAGRTMGGLPAWLVSNDPGYAAGGADGGWSSTTNLVAACTDGTPQRAFTQALLDTAIQLTWQNGGKVPPYLLAGPKQRQIFSGFDGITSATTGQYHETDDFRIIGRADVYASNFGDMRVVPERFIRTAAASGADREVFGVNPEYVQLAELRPFQEHELARTGDSEKRQLVWEGTLKMLNEAAHFKVPDLS